MQPHRRPKSLPAAQGGRNPILGNSGSIRAQIRAGLSAADRAIMDRWSRRMGVIYIVLAMLVLAAGVISGSSVSRVEAMSNVPAALSQRP
jgi:hypothetical protein